jgi:hypothetical protein
VDDAEGDGAVAAVVGAADDVVAVAVVGVLVDGVAVGADCAAAEEDADCGADWPDWPDWAAWRGV